MNELAPKYETTPAVMPLGERLAKLRQQAAQAIETWQPEPGESVVGILVGSQKAVGA